MCVCVCVCAHGTMSFTIYILFMATFCCWVFFAVFITFYFELNENRVGRIDTIHGTERSNRITCIVFFCLGKCKVGCLIKLLMAILILYTHNAGSGKTIASAPIWNDSIIHSQRIPYTTFQWIQNVFIMSGRRKKNTLKLSDSLIFHSNEGWKTLF